MYPQGYASPPFGLGFGQPIPIPPPVVYGAYAPHAMEPSQPLPQDRGQGGRGRSQQPPGATPRVVGIVSQIKGIGQQATAGQQLELARYFANKLSNENAGLYAQFLAGLGVKGTGVSQSAANHLAAPSSSSSLDSSSRLILADRKRRWKELCDQDPDVEYWRATVDTLKGKFGSSAAADELVLTDESVDVRRFFLGKQKRELLLAAAGLAREGSSLITIDDGDTSSQCGKEENVPATQPMVVREESKLGNEMKSIREDMSSIQEAVRGLIEFHRRMPAMAPQYMAPPSPYHQYYVYPSREDARFGEEPYGPKPSRRHTVTRGDVRDEENEGEERAVADPPPKEKIVTPGLLADVPKVPKPSTESSLTGSD